MIIWLLVWWTFDEWFCSSGCHQNLDDRRRWLDDWLARLWLWFVDLFESYQLTEWWVEWYLHARCRNSWWRIRIRFWSGQLMRWVRCVSFFWVHQNQHLLYDECRNINPSLSRNSHSWGSVSSLCPFFNKLFFMAMYWDSTGSSFSNISSYLKCGWLRSIFNYWPTSCI